MVAGHGLPTEMTVYRRGMEMECISRAVLFCTEEQGRGRCLLVWGTQKSQPLEGQGKLCHQSKVLSCFNHSKIDFGTILGFNKYMRT